MKAAVSLALFVSLVGTPPGPIARSIAREAARLAIAPEIQPARSVVGDYRLDNPYPGAQGGASVWFAKRLSARGRRLKGAETRIRVLVPRDEHESETACA